MPRRLLAHPATKPSGRAADIERVRAQLLDVDAERRKQIDTVIDYFGAAETKVQWSRAPTSPTVKTRS